MRCVCRRLKGSVPTFLERRKRMKSPISKRNKLLWASVILLCFAMTPSLRAQSNQLDGSQHGQWFKSIITDKACYDPLSTVTFSVSFKQQVYAKRLLIVYEHLDSVITQDTIQIQNADSVSWAWEAPNVDYYGMMVGLFIYSSDTLLDHTTIGVDVSSNWSKFPRYGFLSSYPYMSQESIDSIISVLNRYHINGLQFYDWQYKHNEPLAGTVQNPDSVWKDIGNRNTYLSTVEGYIESAHLHGMKAMNYNLLYGAYSDAYQDGVDITWSLFTDPNHQSRSYFSLPPPTWASNLYIMDPGNTDWQNYIYAQERKAFLAIPFDGWHVDQLGDLGPEYNYDGQPVDLPGTFTSFLADAKAQLNVDLVMNAVGQYGQQQIAQAPVDFLYTEVWPPDTTYADLVNIINQNKVYSGGRLATVLAAYMDDVSNGSGFFNTPGVLMTDATIFAAGGDHLELGEHMLNGSYFPSSSLQMSATLQDDLVHYYDFLVGYENLLRDGESQAALPLSASVGATSIPVASLPQLGGIWSLISAKKHMMVVNLINFHKAISVKWRDTGGIQTAPDTLSALNLSFSSSSQVTKVWCASPDFEDGSPVPVPFTQAGANVSFTVPNLLYWDMIVVQYDTTFTAVKTLRNGVPRSFVLHQNYPNPFNPGTTIEYEVPFNTHVTIDVYNVLGQKVSVLVDRYMTAGDHQVTFNASGLSSGVYICAMEANGKFLTNKMVLVK